MIHMVLANIIHDSNCTAKRNQAHALKRNQAHPSAPKRTQTHPSALKRAQSGSSALKRALTSMMHDSYSTG